MASAACARSSTGNEANHKARHESHPCTLAMDAKEHPEEWVNSNITDYLGQIASWIDDESAFDHTTDWEKVDFKTFAKILYMGKIYE